MSRLVSDKSFSSRQNLCFTLNPSSVAGANSGCNSFTINITTIKHAMTAAELRVSYKSLSPISNHLLVRHRTLVVSRKHSNGTKEKLIAFRFTLENEGALCVNVTSVVKRWAEQGETTISLHLAVFNHHRQVSCDNDVTFESSSGSEDLPVIATYYIDKGPNSVVNKMQQAGPRLNVKPIYTNPPPSKHRLCHKQQYQVDLGMLGVVAPKNFTFSVCKGRCRHPLPSALLPERSENAVLRAYLNRAWTRGDPPQPPCCTPRNLEGAHFLLMENGIPTIRYWPDLSAIDCQCT